MSDHDPVKLRLKDRTVAEYVLAPDVGHTLSPRPYLHPVNTLSGVEVTDTEPADHRWHLGASLAVQDVAGTNLWGGRTYLRDTGYTWRQDHGRIVHDEFTTRTDAHLAQRLRWCDPDGETLLTEQRDLRARLLDGVDHVWVLDVSYTLTAPARDIALGSPATNGRPGGAGYGGFFWRAAPGPQPPRVFTATASGEASVNGSTEPWVALASHGPRPYTLIFTGLNPGDHWFVRSRMYPGVCAAFAFEKPRVIPARDQLTGAHSVVIADALLSPGAAKRMAATAAAPPGVTATAAQP